MNKAINIVIILLISILGLLFWVQRGTVTQETVLEEVDEKYIEVSFLYVDQGDATLIEWPDGKQMLIDCSKDSRVLEALGRVMEFYDRHIDYLVITHPDLDHFGGCHDVLTRFKIDELFMNGAQKDYLPEWRSLVSEIERQDSLQKTIVNSMAEIQIGGSELSFLYPDHAVDKDWRVPGSEFNPDINDTSVVIRLDYGDQSALFTGDAEEPLEFYLLEKFGEELDVELLKVGHHGSGSSSIEPFLDAVSPIYAVISAGKDNSYGHPTRRVLKRLERVGAEVYRTDLSGDITFKMYKNKLSSVEQ